MPENLPGEALEMSGTFTRIGSSRHDDSKFALLHAYETNNLEMFEKTLREKECEVNHLYEKDYRTLLDMSSEDLDRVDYGKLLVKHGADVNLTNAVRGRAPIHFAATAGNLDMLQLLVNSGADVNSVDKRSFTILHCVCEQKWTPGDDRFKKCLQYLLTLDSLNINALNKKGQTAIHLAALQGSEETVRMLLEKGSNLDLDSNRIGPGKKSARDVIMEKFPHLQSDLPVVQPIQMIKMDTSKLFNLLARGLEDRFCEAFKKEMEDKAQKALLTANNGEYTFLQYSCSEGLVTAAKTLLEEGADINGVGVNTTRPVQIACNKGDVKTLQLLLEHNPDCSPDNNGETVLHTLAKESQVTKFSDCLNVLLNSPTTQNVDVNVQDFKGNTALHYAVKYGDKKSVLELLKHGAYIGTTNVFNETPLSSMPYNTLEEHLNSCLTTNNLISREENYGLIFNYKFLIPSKYNKYRTTYNDEVKIPLTQDNNIISSKKSKKIYLKETDPLVYISQMKDLRQLLKHPIFASFIYLKWQRISLLYYVNTFFYLLFCLFLTGFVLSGQKQFINEQINPNEITTESDKILHEKINESKVDKPMITNDFGFFDIVRFILILFTSVLIVRELFQFLVSPKKYLTSFENWLEILIIFVTVSIISLGCNRNGDVGQCSQMFAIVILASWIELVLLIGKHPLLCVNIEMFKTVSLNFLKFLSWYIILIIAFALSFYTLFRYCSPDACSENLFLNPFSSMFKTLIMLTGEFESGEIPFVSYVGTSHLIFVLFIFVIVIVLVNLLNGLAVSDTQIIRDDAILYSYISRVKLISYFETMVLGDPLFFRGLYKRIRELCGCVPDTSVDQPVLCIEYFAKRIVFFSGLMPEGVIYVYPNKQNGISFNSDPIMCQTPDCFTKLTEYCLDEGTSVAAKEIIADNEVKNDTSEIECLKLELQTCLSALNSVQKRLEVVENGNKQNEQLLIQILAIISLNTNR